jgi:hypothetical protein
MHVNDPVREHRAQLQEQRRVRLEVWVGQTLIDQVRQMARLKSVPVWSAVEDALEAHLEEYRQLLADGRCLSDERARILMLMGIAEYQPQITEYNRQLAVYNERLATFHGVPSP